LPHSGRSSIFLSGILLLVWHCLQGTTIAPLRIGELSEKSCCLHLPQVGLCPSLEDGNLFAAPQLLHLTWYSVVSAIAVITSTIHNYIKYEISAVKKSRDWIGDLGLQIVECRMRVVESCSQNLDAWLKSSSH